MNDALQVSENLPLVISSQRYLDDEIVEEKRAFGDYVVSYYDIEVGDVEFRVVVDGHHSLAAAKLDGVEPVMIPVPRAIASEYDYEVDKWGADAWLENHQHDSDYYAVESLELVF